MTWDYLVCLQWSHREELMRANLLLACDVILANINKFREQGTVSNAHAVYCVYAKYPSFWVCQQWPTTDAIVRHFHPAACPWLITTYRALLGQSWEVNKVNCSALVFENEKSIIDKAELYLSCRDIITKCKCHLWTKQIKLFWSLSGLNGFVVQE